MNNKTLFISLAVMVFLIGGFAIAYDKTNSEGSSSDTYVSFAQCLTDSGAKFYGAFWCQHCNNQKRAFGGAADFIPYVECSTLDRQQTQVCADAGITGYPTWVFANGEQLSGNHPLPTLAEISGCELPIVEG